MKSGQAVDKPRENPKRMQQEAAHGLPWERTGMHNGPRENQSLGGKQETQ
jgi:hypothetical protein